MKITKTWARKMLKAVNETIELYKGGNRSNGGNCSFCKAGNEMEDRLGMDKCFFCPWIIFKKQRCTGQDMKKYASGYGWETHIADMRYDKTPTLQRLPRLYGWRKRLTNIIERGK